MSEPDAHPKVLWDRAAQDAAETRSDSPGGKRDEPLRRSVSAVTLLLLLIGFLVFLTVLSNFLLHPFGV